MIDQLRDTVSEQILHLFTDVSTSPHLNVLTKEDLIKEIGSVQSKEQLATEISNQIGESFEVDPDAFEQKRIIKLTAPLPQKDTQKHLNMLRNEMNSIDSLIELPETSGEKIRESGSAEDFILYEFTYVYTN